MQQQLRISSPVGVLTLVANAEALLSLSFAKGNARTVDATPTGHPILDQAHRELDEYFAGKRRKFSVPLNAVGTDFQRAVWQAIAEIPFGKLISYGAIAEGIKNPRAVRAVGGATGNNPLAIIIPCHRVVGKDGSLTGFGGGMERKKWLLAHEGSLGETF